MSSEDKIVNDAEYFTDQFLSLSFYGLNLSLFWNMSSQNFFVHSNRSGHFMICQIRMIPVEDTKVKPVKLTCHTAVPL